MLTVKNGYWTLNGKRHNELNATERLIFNLLFEHRKNKIIESLDDYIEGTHNPFNPANQEDEDHEDETDIDEIEVEDAEILENN